jgi:hypothetical protein
LIKYSNNDDTSSGEEDSEGLIDPSDIEESEELRSELKLFYVDRGRYEKHVYSALTSRGFRQLIHCAQSESVRDEGWNRVRSVFALSSEIQLSADMTGRMRLLDC